MKKTMLIATMLIAAFTNLAQAKQSLPLTEGESEVSASEDFDQDGIPNDQDEDDDNDGVTDTEDEDDDNDGVTDTEDEDDDNDGVTDTEDNLDSDGDGISDDRETSQEG